MQYRSASTPTPLSRSSLSFQSSRKEAAGAAGAAGAAEGAKTRGAGIRRAEAEVAAAAMERG